MKRGVNVILLIASQPSITIIAVLQTHALRATLTRFLLSDFKQPILIPLSDISELIVKIITLNNTRYGDSFHFVVKNKNIECR
jgi:hypothetical protein